MRRVNKQKQFKSHLAKQFSNFLMTLTCCGFLPTEKKDRKKERKKAAAAAMEERRTAQLVGNPLSKQYYLGLGLDRQRVSAQWKRLIDTSLAACSEAINNFDFYFPPLSPAPFLLLTQTNNKKFIKEKPKENNAQIGEETKRW